MRRGFRTALVRARRPTGPNGLASTAPRAPTIGPGQRRGGEQHGEDQTERSGTDDRGRATTGAPRTDHESHDAEDTEDGAGDGAHVQ